MIYECIIDSIKITELYTYVVKSGERITAESGGPGLGMITGLDPAEPYFQGYGPAVILDPTDAMFVEVGPLMAVSAFT